jgi:hypothetical protein
VRRHRAIRYSPRGKEKERVFQMKRALANESGTHIVNHGTRRPSSDNVSPVVVFATLPFLRTTRRFGSLRFVRSLLVRDLFPTAMTAAWHEKQPPVNLSPLRTLCCPLF